MLKFCVAECCFVKSRRWYRVGGSGALEPEVARRALVVAHGRRALLSGKAKAAFPEDLQQAVICEKCRERIGESVAMGEEKVVSLRSNIKGAGYGLFAMVDLEPGEWITNYGGELMSKMRVAEAVARRIQTSHFMMVTRSHTINGLRNYRETVPGVCWKGLAQFINRWCLSRQQECNVLWKKNAAALRCEARASKAIPAGTELIAHYGVYQVAPAHSEKRPHVKLKRQVPTSLDPRYRQHLMATPRTCRRVSCVSLRCVPPR